MRKLIYTTITLLFAVAFAYGQFNATPVQWGLPQGGITYAQNGDTLDCSFNWFNDILNGIAPVSQNWSTLDINGDGKPDLLITDRADLPYYGDSSFQYWKVHMNTGNGFSNDSIIWPVPVKRAGDSILLQFWYPSVTASTNAAYSPSWRMTDMNGDGKADLVVTSYTSPVTSGKHIQFEEGTTPYWRVYLNTGAGFALTATNWNTPAGGQSHYLNGTRTSGFIDFTGFATYFYDEAWFLRDMNGDGKPDLVVSGRRDSTGYYTQYSADPSPYWHVYLNTGTGFATSPLHWPVPVSGKTYANTDSVVYGYLSYSSVALPGIIGYYGDAWDLRDMDGDGKPDLLVTAYAVPPEGEQYQFGAATGNPYWKVYLNTGSGFATTAVQWPTPQGGYVGIAGLDTVRAGINADTLYNWDLMDINGDGRPDLVNTNAGDSLNNASNAVYGAGSNPYWNVYLNTGTGFETAATNWRVPNGGPSHFTGNDSVAQGFYEISSALTAPSHYYNPAWNVIDVNGDGTPDLVLTSFYDTLPIKRYTAYGTGSNRYWTVYLNQSATGIPTITPTGAACILYPNPNTGNFTLQFADAGNRQIEIYDALGRLILAPTGAQTQQQFNLGAMSAGIYLLRYTQNNEVKFLKFVVER